MQGWSRGVESNSPSKVKFWFSKKNQKIGKREEPHTKKKEQLCFAAVRSASPRRRDGLLHLGENEHVHGAGDRQHEDMANLQLRRRNSIGTYGTRL